MGQWKDGLPHGWGKWTWANGDKYMGDLRMARRMGRGEVTQPKGSKKLGA